MIAGGAEMLTIPTLIDVLLLPKDFVFWCVTVASGMAAAIIFLINAGNRDENSSGLVYGMADIAEDWKLVTILEKRARSILPVQQRPIRSVTVLTIRASRAAVARQALVVPAVFCVANCCCRGRNGFQ